MPRQAIRTHRASTISDVDTGETIRDAGLALPAPTAASPSTPTGESELCARPDLADPLTAGQSVTDTLTVHSADGTATQLSIVNITGSNDAASIGAVTGSAMP